MAHFYVRVYHPLNTVLHVWETQESWATGRVEPPSISLIIINISKHLHHLPKVTNNPRYLAVTTKPNTWAWEKFGTKQFIIHSKVDFGNPGMNLTLTFATVVIPKPMPLVGSPYTYSFVWIVLIRFMAAFWEKLSQDSKWRRLGELSQCIRGELSSVLLAVHT